MKELPARQKIWFFQQFLKLNRLGFGLLESIQLIQETTSHKTLGTHLLSLMHHLQSGFTFSESIKHCPALFDTLTAELIHIGETSNHLLPAIEQLLTHQQKSLHFQAEIKKTLRYPLFLLTLTFFISIFLFSFLIPQFKTLFSEHHRDLPWMTRFLFDCSDFIMTHRFLLLGFILIFVIVLYAMKKNIALFVQYHAWHVPVVRIFKRTHFEMRFSQSLYFLLSAGIPLSECLDLLKHHHHHPAEKNILTTISYALHEGMEFNQAVSILQFSSAFKQLLNINSHSLLLIESLKQHAVDIEREFFERINTFKEWFEPLILLWVGALIGIVVIALYTPIFKLGAFLS